MKTKSQQKNQETDLAYFFMDFDEVLDEGLDFQPGLVDNKNGIC